MSISDKTVIGGGAKIKISGRYQSEDDTSITIEPGSIKLAGTRAATASLTSNAFSIAGDTSAGIVSKSGFKAQIRADTDGDGQLDTAYYSIYEYGGIVHNGKRLSLPEKDGTLATLDDTKIEIVDLTL